MNWKIAFIASVLAFFWTPLTVAQENHSHEEVHMEHGQHSESRGHPAPEAEQTEAEPAESTGSASREIHQDMHHDADMPEMDHTGHEMPRLPADKAEDRVKTHSDEPGQAIHPAHGEGGLAHDSTSMQGGSAPPDARDPSVYAEGYGFGPLSPPVMADQEYFNSLIVDRLESLSTGSKTFMTYDLQYWLGQTFNRALIRAEGDIDDGAFQNARTELLWAHAADPNWDTHLGIRYDKGFGPDRGWLAVGVQGFAPYWIYVEATAYVGEQGRTAFRLETEYDVLLTQKLVLQPRIEANFYGKTDEARALGHGLSDLAIGLRLHYEIWRELAPYIGVEWAGKFGGTADYQRNSGNRVDETRAVAGVQFWF
ncbi:MAG: copper resistance protein B [Methylosarcina sp.]